MLALLGYVPPHYVLVEKKTFHALHQDDIETLVGMGLMLPLVCPGQLCRHHRRHRHRDLFRDLPTEFHSQLLDHSRLQPSQVYI